MARTEQIQQLDRQVQAAVERALRGMREQFGGRLRQASEELLRVLQEASPDVPQSFIGDDDLAPIVAAARAEGRTEGLVALRDAIARVDRAASQEAVLEALLQAATLFASRAALFLTRDGAAQGWGGFGFGESGGRLSEVEVSYADAPWGELAQGRGCVALDEAACGRLCSRLEASTPRQGLLVPLVLRDQVAAAVYADRLTDGSRFDVEALQVLTLHAALALETLPFRTRAATPSLRASAPGLDGLGLWQPSVAPPPEVAVEAEPLLETTEEWNAEAAPAAGAEPVADGLSWSSFAPEPESAAAPPPAAAAEPDVLFEEEPEQLYEGPPAEELAAPAFAPEPAFEVAAEPSVVEETVSEEVWVLDDTAGPEAPTMEAAVEPPSAAPAFEELAPPPVAEPEPPVAFATTAFVTPASPVPETTAAMDLGDDDTMLLERPRFGQQPRIPSGPSTQEMQIPAVPEPADANDETHPGTRRASTEVATPRGWQPGAGTSEVRPPADLAGPGWAFATSRMPAPAAAPAGEESLHDEARRLARLLVSEIKLYNEEQVEEGRRGRDIYERLKDDIDRSRQMYEERVDERVRNKTDYFYQELVRILAAGDAKALGI